MSDEKVYIGTGKVLAGKNGYEARLKTSIHVDDLRKLLEWAEAHNDWCAILWQKRKEPSKTGATHYGVMDTWVPDAPKSSTPTGTPPAETNDPMPF